MKLFDNNGKYAGLHSLDFQIPEGARVLDVGGGNKPFKLATHIADFVSHREQRHFRDLKIGERELIEGDVAETLKRFPNDYFEFCYSNHTFEHIENLADALNEISRTCRRGFYALPGSDFEFFTAHKHYGHVNLCRQIGEVLHFCHRPQNSIIEEFANIYDQLFVITGFNKIWEGHGCRGFRFIWEIRHYWEGEIKFEFHEDGATLYPQLKYFA